jgi:hypothetical protein
MVPVPVPYRGLPLEPADERDPDVFTLDLTRFGMPAARIVFARKDGGVANAVHTDLGGQPWTLVRAPETATRSTLAAALGVAAVATVVATRRRGEQKQVDLALRGSKSGSGSEA